MAKVKNRQPLPTGVRVVTNNRIVYQGLLQPPPPVFPPAPFTPNNNRFIYVLLSCPPELITTTGERVTIEPTLFDEGDLVRINAEDIAIGPSGDCVDNAANTFCPTTS
ncbi:hypothetical protein [Anaeroselena agilis]|uniref:Uncharacterized protein n=1 Tax=Anaeroselena agilis TaxID=3063788 RepID=A0ABU3NW48_9FIRM|nr:hypothetical protein [Selenomonadales bacterium 4137-cl]